MRPSLGRGRKEKTGLEFIYLFLGSTMYVKKKRKVRKKTIVLR